MQLIKKVHIGTYKQTKKFFGTFHGADIKRKSHKLSLNYNKLILMVKLVSISHLKIKKKKNITSPLIRYVRESLKNQYEIIKYGCASCFPFSKLKSGE